jgi:hypothetical protein
MIGLQELSVGDKADVIFFGKSNQGPVLSLDANPQLDEAIKSSLFERIPEMLDRIEPGLFFSAAQACSQDLDQRKITLSESSLKSQIGYALSCKIFEEKVSERRGQKMQTTLKFVHAIPSGPMDAKPLNLDEEISTPDLEKYKQMMIASRLAKTAEAYSVGDMASQIVDAFLDDVENRWVPKAKNVDTPQALSAGPDAALSSGGSRFRR